MLWTIRGSKTLLLNDESGLDHLIIAPALLVTCGNHHHNRALKKKKLQGLQLPAAWAISCFSIPQVRLVGHGRPQFVAMCYEYCSLGFQFFTRYGNPLQPAQVHHFSILMLLRSPPCRPLGIPTLESMVFHLSRYVAVTAEARRVHRHTMPWRLVKAQKLPIMKPRNRVTLKPFIYTSHMFICIICLTDFKSINQYIINNHCKVHSSKNPHDSRNRLLELDPSHTAPNTSLKWWPAQSRLGVATPDPSCFLPKLSKNTITCPTSPLREEQWRIFWFWWWSSWL